LSDQNKFLYPLIRKHPGLVQDGSKFSASVTTPDLPNRAKGAGIGTTLCNLEVSDEGRGGENARRLFIIEESGFRDKTLALRFLRE
jgi:hypothetical protein